MFMQAAHRFAVASSMALLFPAFGSLPIQAEEVVGLTTLEPRDRYFALFFSHQSEDNRIEASHTFATFVRAVGGSQLRVVESRTISWFPVSEIVAVSRPMETGENRSLEKTLAWAEARVLQIFVNGPFEIQPELYRRAIEQADLLDQGGLKYKAFDRFTRTTAKNCVHVLTDMVDGTPINSGGARGQDATLLAIRHLHRFFLSKVVTAEASVITGALNLQRFTQPTSSMVAGRGAVPAVH